MRLLGGVFEHELVEERPGIVVIAFSGEGARRLFADEAGGHRWQRIPPNDKRGRVHTSTVTVAVLDPDAPARFKLDMREVVIRTTRGTGPGGQNRNKVESCVVATCRGVSVRCDMRSQHQSKAMALKLLAVKLAEHDAAEHSGERSELRRAQVGSGMRGDKRRTYREQDDRVVDHVTGKSWRLKAWRRGEW